mgnify:CR=1 FL=1
MHLPIAPCYVPTKGYQTSVAVVSRGHGEVGTLCVTEVSDVCEDESINKYGSICDLFCLLVDVTKPLSVLAMERIIEKLPTDCKVVVVETKSDLMKEV